MSHPHALLVDDDSDTVELLATLVEREGFSTSRAGTLEEAREELKERSPDIVLLDLKLPDGKGLELLDDIPEPWSEVVLITAHGSLETAIHALRQGVSDYLLKPVDVKRLKGMLARVANARELRREIADLRAELRELGRFGSLVGRSPAMQEVYDRMARVAPTSATVLITGESGTGKELAARTLHDLSRRHNGPFWAVNCGAVPENLIESTLFGHEKGAFTGADRQHKGYFERSDAGTLLLDEITEMPTDLQVKLLRVLETGELTRVGGEKSIPVDVRVIAASNRELDDALADDELREDLYYRLKVFDIHMPPLRERGDDIDLLARVFLDDTNREEETNKKISTEALKALRDYPWPGNVRELKNVVRSAYILADELIEVSCLPSEIVKKEGLSRVVGPSVQVRLGSTIADAERSLIMATLDYCGGNKSKTADTLGISVRTLYNRLEDYKSDGGG